MSQLSTFFGNSDLCWSGDAAEFPLRPRASTKRYSAFDGSSAEYAAKLDRLFLAGSFAENEEDVDLVERIARRIVTYAVIRIRVVLLESFFQIALEDADVNTRLVGGLRP
jgi:hypothetical protein